EQLDGLVEVAVRLGQRLLAVHHPGLGELTELLDVGSGEVGHGPSSLQFGGSGRGGAQVLRAAAVGDDQAVGSSVAVSLSLTAAPVWTVSAPAAAASTSSATSSADASLPAAGASVAASAAASACGASAAAPVASEAGVSAAASPVAAAVAFSASPP